MQWRRFQEEKELIIVSFAEVLTCLIGRDIDRGKLWVLETFAGNAVHRLDFKGVLRVGHQVADVDVPLGQAELAGDELHVVIATHAQPALHATLLADDVVEQVIPPTRVSRFAPLQY